MGEKAFEGVKTPLPRALIQVYVTLSDESATLPVLGVSSLFPAVIMTLWYSFLLSVKLFRRHCKLSKEPFFDKP